VTAKAAPIKTKSVVKPVAIPKPKVAVPPIPVPTPKTVVPPTTLPLSQPTPKKNTDAAIPPFHTLNKTVTTPVQTIDTSEFAASAKNVKPSVLANPGEEPLSVNSRDTSDNGTIITDTKRNRFSIWGAIQESLSSWFATQKQTALRKKTPTYTVPEADRRKGVIQKATTQTGRTSTSDHAAVVSRIKSSQKTVRRSSTPVVTTPTPAVVRPSHLPIVEPFAEVEPTLPEQITSPIPVPVAVPEPVIDVPPPVPQTRPRITPSIPTIPEPVETPAQVVSEPITVSEKAVSKSIAEKLQELEQATEKTNETIVAESAPSVTPIERPRITPSIPEASVPTPVAIEDGELSEVSTTEEDPTESDTPATTPNWAQSITATEKSISRNAVAIRLFLSRTNHIALGVAGGISVVVIGWYGVQTLRNIRTTVAPTATTENSTALLTTGTRIATTTLVAKKEDFTRTLRASDSGTDSLSEVTIENPTTHTQLSPSEFFTLLGARVTTNFTAAIDRVGFGSYHGTPWLILHSSDNATVQGGMLAWENNLDSDLSGWFSTTTLHTTKKGITLFHDDTIAGKDVRILSDSDGKERVVYGFIKPNLLLITNNTTTFLNLADKGN
jgi:hypothetical protein